LELERVGNNWEEFYVIIVKSWKGFERVG